MQFPRLLKLPEKRHLFLFGARNTGKSTLINKRYSADNTLLIDLLDEEEAQHFTRHHNALTDIVTALPDDITHVVIDEIQKAPKLLNTVQQLMSKTDKTFIMTGSSARKLKHGGANLLAGRAFVYHLFPLSFIELGDKFQLEAALQWGTLPEIFICENNEEKSQFLKAYAHTYLKEEIWEEQFIRALDPFRKFMESAAQCNGKIINFNNIARDVGVDVKTIINYFSILEDTLVGFFLEAFQHSFRKRLSQKPKFYFFDTGVVRSLTFMTTAPLKSGTSAYGEAFEHFIILECQRLASYFNLEYRFSYLQTSAGAEIDLVVERPGKPLLCIEIKSAKQIVSTQLTSFKQLTLELDNCEAVCFCQERYPKQIDHIKVLPWKKGLETYFTKQSD